jgi:CheY-like chemotaxis protein
MAYWMLVEDEMHMYEMLIALTETLGYSGLAFPTREEAVAWIDDFDAERIRETPPLLALIDVRLGDERGEDVAQRLRGSPRLGHIPIIMISAYTPQLAAQQDVLQRAGADLFLSKPLPNLGEFRRIIDDLLGAHR